MLAGPIVQLREEVPGSAQQGALPWRALSLVLPLSEGQRGSLKKKADSTSKNKTFLLYDY